MTGHVDLLPTLAELADADLSKLNQRDRLDGLSLVPLLQSGEDERTASFKRRMLVHHRARWSELPDVSSAEVIERHKYAYCCVRWNQYLLMRVEPCDDERCVTCHQVRTRCLPGGPSRPYTNNLEHYIAPRPGVWQLYDLDRDLFQNDDISLERPDVVEAMSTKFEDWWGGVWRSDRGQTV